MTFSSACAGPASKRFGIDGDREAVPLMLEVMYNRVRSVYVNMQSTVTTIRKLIKNKIYQMLDKGGV